MTHTPCLPAQVPVGVVAKVPSVVVTGPALKGKTLQGMGGTVASITLKEPNDYLRWS